MNFWEKMEILQKELNFFYFGKKNKESRKKIRKTRKILERNWKTLGKMRTFWK